MSSKTKTTYAPESANQLAYQQQQLALGQKQLDYLTQQATAQQDYMTSIKPAMEAQTALYQKALEQANTQPTPQEADITQKQNDLLQQQLSAQTDLAPLQKQALEAQLKQQIAGNNATPEQIAQIDAATKAARDAGMSDISYSSSGALKQLRDTLAPSLGLRPTDTPILDRGALVEQEATRQAGMLVSNLAAANANARLNYPLASAGVSQAGSQSAAQIGDWTQNFQAQLAQAAATNRLNLLQTSGQAAGQGLQGGLGLISGARGNPLSFQRDSTSKTSDPWGTAIGIAKGFGSVFQPFSLAG